MDLLYTGERFMPGHDGPGIHLEHLHRYYLAASVVGGRVLDLGCGVGYGARLLAARAQRVVGIDLSPPAARFADAGYGAPGLAYLAGDCRCLPLADGSFDWVVCFELIEHVREAEAVLAEVKRVLTPGGHLLISTPNRPVYSEARGYRNPYHQREFDHAEFASLLAAEFDQVSLFGQGLVAGSWTWSLEGRGPAAPPRIFQPAPELAPGMAPGGEPLYLVALCSRRSRPRGVAGESVLPGRLAAFVEEEAERAGEREAALRREYEAVVERLRQQLQEFDARVRELGSDLERRHAAQQEQGAELTRYRAAEEERERTLAAMRARETSLALELERLEPLVAEVAELKACLVRMQAEQARLYGEWQRSQAELAAIHGSKSWRLWMLYHRLRRGGLAAASWLARLPGRILRSPFHAAGLLYLALWTLREQWLAAVRRRQLRRSTAPASPETVPETRCRPRVLMVCPYPIYPPDHGGGVRLYNLIRHLAPHCRLYLLVFIRGEDDPVQRQALEPLVERLYFHHWVPRLRPDLWRIQPPGAQLFDAPEVPRRINEILTSEGIDLLHLDYTEMGQFGLPEFARVKVVLSEVDITFRSRARRRAAGFHRRYRSDRIFGHSFGDWLRQFRYELTVARRADQVQVMSRDDGAYLASYLSHGWRSLRVVANAVDPDHYRPPVEGVRRNRRLLFVGNFQHLPNLDALDFLMAEIWPRVRRRLPDAELFVVGAEAGEPVRRYHGRDGVTVVGAVPDLKPYYQGFHSLLAPIRAGSGTRLKILEALACAMPVVTTTIGAEGIECTHERHLLIADTAADLAAATCRLLADEQLAAALGLAGRRLVEESYTWASSAAAMLAGYRSLLDAQTAAAAELPPLGEAPAVGGGTDISIIIPTLDGGAALERCLAAVSRQQIERSFEVLCVDSGSSEADLAVMRRYGVRLVCIPRSEFNHGLTRDLGAERSLGRVLVYINQDAVPCDDHWLAHLTEPFFTAGGVAAVQGAIHEVPDPEQRFYWHSCGHRFYFTRESERWHRAYFGIGFSTVNAAIRREVWSLHRFGDAPIMEDKKWQREVVDAGYAILLEPRATVHHTHNYCLRPLLRRCESEGFGWRTVGETYSLLDMLRDMGRGRVYWDLCRGLAQGRIRSWAELLFPWLRPLMLYRGNRWSQGVKL